MSNGGNATLVSTGSAVLNPTARANDASTGASATGAACANTRDRETPCASVDPVADAAVDSGRSSSVVVTTHG